MEIMDSLRAFFHEMILPEFERVKTEQAALTISGPMPSPGMTAMV